MDSQSTILKVLLDKVEALQAEVKALRDSHLPAFISTKEYARHSSLDVSTVIRLCKKGELVCKQKGNRWLISRKELEV